MKEPWGGVDNILKIQGLNPASLRGHFEFYKTLMRGPSGLRHLTNNNELVEKLAADFRSAQIAERDLMMLEYAVKLTREPWNMIQADVQRLRKAGFEDVDILDINQITGYFAFVNRPADGLGVELEPYWNEATYD